VSTAEKLSRQKGDSKGTEKKNTRGNSTRKKQNDLDPLSKEYLELVMEELLRKPGKKRANVTDMLRVNKPILLAALKQLEADKVVITYSGGGDDGCIDEACVTKDGTPLTAASVLEVEVISESSVFEGTPERGKWVNKFNKKLLTLKDALYEFAGEWLDLEHPGCFNNDGAQGEIVIDVSKGSFRMDHGDNYTETNYSEHEL
jgi:hypothetical protein